MTTDRFRTTLAAAALAASVSIVGVASAHEGKDSGKHGGKSKPCKVKGKGKGYEVQGSFAWADLEQVAGAATPRTNDDRFTGTVVVDVEKGNRRGRRDLGLSLYTVTGVRVIGAAADGTLPGEGARVQLVGKQLTAAQARSCDPAPTTPAPTTPEPTTPGEPTDPEPTASLLERPAVGPKVDDPAADETDDVVAAEDHASDDERSADDDPKGDDHAKPDDDDATPHDRKPGHPKSGDDAGDDDDASDDSASDDDAAGEPTAVTDVAIRVVHFKVRPKAARR